MDRKNVRVHEFNGSLWAVHYLLRQRLDDEISTGGTGVRILRCRMDG